MHTGTVSMKRQKAQQSIPWFLRLDRSDLPTLYGKRSFLALDFETDSEQKGSALVESNDIVLACWTIYKDGKVVSKHKFGGIYDMQELLDDIASVDFLLAFNAKFELQWLKRCGMELRDVLVYDPMLAQWVLDGNQKGKGYERSLRGMARRYGTRPKLDIVGLLLDAEVPTRDINEAWLLEYCERDVSTMVDIFRQQLKHVGKRDVWHLVHTRNLTCSVLADTEFAGLELDKKAVEEEYNRTQGVLQDLGMKLSEMTGGINLSSPKQLATFLYDVLKFEEVRHRGKPLRTGKDERSTAATTLAQLDATTDAQKKFLLLYKEYNKVLSLLEKNLAYFQAVCEHKDGRFFGLIKQNSVGTHRLASSGIRTKFPVGEKVDRKGKRTILYKEMTVQLQNIPREFKGLFWAKDDDYVICSYDSSQVEFRVAVDMGHDRVGYEEVSSGVDIHSFTAKVLTEAGEPTTRQEAKAKTFRPLYGGGSGSKALVAYCEYFKEKYEGISSMQHGWALKCADKKEYVTPYGMTFFFPAVLQDSGYVTFTTQIYNFPIQGFATGEIIPLALVYFWHKTRQLRCNIFVTIHDSIDSRVHKDDVEAVDAIAVECLTTDVYAHLERVYNYKMRTPLGLGMKAGKHWGDGDEKKYDVFPNGEVVER